MKHALGASLNNLANRVWETGRRDEAVALAEEAMRIYRDLAAANLALYEPILAKVISNLAAKLPEMGRPKDALQFAEESVRIFRRVAATSPAMSGIRQSPVCCLAR